MNTAMFLRAAVSRWYIVLLGVVVTALAAGALYLRVPTVYWGQTTVTLLQPEPNPLATESFPLTDLTSALVLQVNGRPAQSKTSSPITTLYGEGIHEGSRIRLRDIGGQWTTSIPDPVILVEAVGATPADVEGRIAQQVDRLHEGLTVLQADLEVDAPAQVFMQSFPDRPEAIPVTGSRTRAAGATALLGCAATVLALYFVNRRRPVGRPNRKRKGGSDHVVSDERAFEPGIHRVGAGGQR